MNKRKKAWAIIGVCTLVIIAMLWRPDPPPLCNDEIKSKSVILIDHSEAVSHQTANAILERSWNFIQSKVKVGERISLYFVDHNTNASLTPVFSECKPRIEGNGLTEGDRKLKRKFEKNFRGPLLDHLSAPMTGSKVSPIAQAITDISLDDIRFRSEDITNLLIFSDFMENDKGFSLYRCTSGEDAIQNFRFSRHGAVERPHFENVMVHMHLIPRHGMSNQELSCRATFWNWFFGNRNGQCENPACLTVDYLPG